jgi:hypothetical protein
LKNVIHCPKMTKKLSYLQLKSTTNLLTIQMRWKYTQI